MKIVNAIVAFLYSGMATGLGLMLLSSLHTSSLKGRIPWNDYAAQLDVYKIPLPGSVSIVIAGCMGVFCGYWLFRFMERL